MKKIKFGLQLIIVMMIFIGNIIPVMARDFTVRYQKKNDEGELVDINAALPLTTDEYDHLAYHLNTNSSKLFTYNYNMQDTNLTTSYYVFGKNSSNKWINTSYGNNQGMKENEDDKRFVLGWNTGIIYNNIDYVYATDVDNYRKAASITENRESDIGIVIKTEFKFRSEGRLLEVIYHVKNNTNTKKDFLLWSGGDTELATDDGCAVGVLNREKARGFYLYSVRTDDYPDALNVQMPIFATDDKVSFWRTDKWADIRDIYDSSVVFADKYRKSFTELLSNPPSYIADQSKGQKPQDTAAIWYWKDQSLNAGEEKVYSVLIGITNFTDDVENKVAGVIEEANNEINNETYTVTFNLANIKDGGTIPQQEVDSRGKVTRPEDPIHDGNMIFDDWYTDETFTTKFDFENTIITDATEIHGRWKLPPGTIKVIDPITKPDVIAEILTPSKDITDAITLTDEELALKEEGKDVSVYVEVNDASDDVTDEEKDALEEKIDNKTEIGTYLDIGLFKKVDGEEPTKIAKSKEPIELSIEIPKNLKNTDPNVERTYKLVKIENGELVEIELREVDGNLLFETDDFSIYALAYSDKKINNPNTFDGIMMYLIIFTISIIILRILYVNIRKTRGAN